MIGYDVYKKIIFLDVDGVLNYSLFYENNEQNIKQEFEKEISDYVKEGEYFYKRHIDFKLVKQLHKFCEDEYASIVISSSWRIAKSVNELKDIFDSISVGLGKYIIDKTDSSNHGIRGVEVKQWLDKYRRQLSDNNREEEITYNYLVRYVIFDDDSDFLIWQANNFIKIDRYCGLNYNHLYKAKKILNGEYDFEMRV